MWVGDDDQTIYQWRGSAAENILTFENRYPEVEQIRLEENFRSSEGVIETARGFINKVSPRLPKSMKFADAQPYETGDVVALSFDSPEEEAEYIAKTLRSLHGVAFTDGDEDRGLAWSDMAILLRSVRHNGTPITQALKEANIPFVVSGLTNLFATEEACAARDLFYFVVGDSPDGRSITVPELRRSWEDAGVGLSGKCLGTALEYAEGVRANLQMEKGEPSPSLQFMYLKFLELAELREENVPDQRGETVLFNLGRFSEVITDWESIHYRSNPFDSLSGVCQFSAFSGHQFLQ